MRSKKERLYQALSFEIIALFFAIPMGVFFFKMSISDIGILTVIGATLATIWVYIYNRAFDTVLKKITGQIQKTIKLRVLHAILFEAGLLIVLLPIIAWYLKISLMEALIMDLAFIAFYLVYAFVFNWVYDVLFPVKEARA
tara:strand:- start:391613 stop:392035 length:423 start_codon:yes stop_codon:yes gene_type:complete